MAKKKMILVIRFSAMGDVAMCLPVISEIAKNNIDLHFLVLTKSKFSPLFSNQKNIEVFSVNFEKEYKGVFGLLKLVNTLTNQYNILKLIDLHLNLRTFVLKLLFKIKGIKSFSLDKGRGEKKQLTQRKNKHLIHLKHTTDRYFDVFKLAGINKPGKLEISGNYFGWKNKHLSDSKLIGIAPFAQHKGKIWPFSNFETLINDLNILYPNLKIYLFGGGEHEVKKLKLLSESFKNAEVVAGKYKLNEELELIAKLDCMIAMDSSNLHFAAISGIKTISIWGATHPFLGFGPVGVQKHELVQNTDLNCRPCSVYGNKKCFRGDYACLNSITIDQVLASFKKIIEA